MTDNTRTIQNIPVADIVPGDNDRKTFDSVKIEQRAQQIKENGFRGAIWLRPLPSCKHEDAIGHRTFYEIIDGECRFRSVRDVLKWESIPAIIYDNVTDEEASTLMLAANESREDLNAMEQAEAYEKRIQRFNWTADRVALSVGRSADFVKRRLGLLKLTWEAQHLVKSGNLPIGIAETMIDLDSNRQRIALRVFNTTDGMSLAAFRKLCSNLLEEQNQEALFDLENFWKEQVAPDKRISHSGPNAITHAPTRSDLPLVEVKGTDSASIVIERYILALLSSGHSAEAGAVGNLYNALVSSKNLRTPENSLLANSDKSL